METTYYTPESEELCLGFELETKNVFVHDFDWTKAIIEKNMFAGGYDGQTDIYDIISGIDKGKVRVKNLTIHDLDLLGFSTTNMPQEINGPANMLLATKETEHRGNQTQLCIYYNMVSKWALIYLSGEEGVWVGEEWWSYDKTCHFKFQSAGSTVFAGCVKNRFELTRILKQLNLK